MNRTIAKQLLTEELARVQQLTWDEASLLVDQVKTSEVVAADGRTYYLEIVTVWDDKRDGDVRFMVSVDDGGLRAFVPMTDSEIIKRKMMFSI